MGTNFYVRGHRHDDDPEFHLGKRSAAGFYCWDCKTTLCKGRVHYGDSFHDACPVCGEKPAHEELSESLAGRELGFNQSAPSAKKGVRSCSSFSWAMEQGRFHEILEDKPGECPTCGHDYEDDAPIEDEYGKTYTAQEFMDVLAECPLVFRESVGSCFS